MGIVPHPPPLPPGSSAEEYRADLDRIRDRIAMNAIRLPLAVLAALALAGVMAISLAR